jgi:hypothetical protein
MSVLPVMLDSGAVFSPCQKYRYRLWRTWDESLPVMLCVGLNPSTADETVNDPTIRRVIGFAARWGFGKLFMGNLFALRSTDPKALYGECDPTGPENDAHIQGMATVATRILAAWGKHGTYRRRDVEVLQVIGPRDVVALNVNRDQTPAHPLYQKGDAQPFAYQGRLAGWLQKEAS